MSSPASVPVRSSAATRGRHRRLAAAGIITTLSMLLLGLPALLPGLSSSPSVSARADSNPGTSEGNFVALPQTEIVDTRSGLGLPEAKLTGGTTYNFTATGGSTGVPTSGVSAIELTLITTNTTNSPWVTVWPAGQTRPGITNITADPSQNMSGSAYVAPGTNGQISAYTGTGSTDFIVWVTGYFTTTDNTAGFAPLTGTRVLDTRHGIGAPQAQIPANGSLTFSTAAAGVPTSATAVVLTFTVYSAANSYLNAGIPGSNTEVEGIGFPASNPNPTSITSITQSSGQMVQITAGPANAIDVLVDVTGYFGAAEAGGGFTAHQSRIYASNAQGSQTVPANGTLTIPITNVGGVPAVNGSDNTVGAVALDVTVVNAGSTGYLRAFATGLSEPTSIQTITFNAGETDTNSTVLSTTTPATGQMEMRNFSNSALTVYIDVQGWFSPYYNPNPGGSFPGGAGSQSFSHFTSVALSDRDQIGVNEASGNGLYSAGDVDIAGQGVNLTVGRDYNSRSTAVGAFGTGWTMDAGGDIKLIAGSGSPAPETLDGPTGYAVTFAAKTGGGYTSPAAIDATLAVDTTQNPSGFKLTFNSSGQKWTFTSTGQLTSIGDRNGNKITYGYNGSGQLTSIIDPLGQQKVIAIAWTNNRVTSMADSTGRTWTYGYNGANQLVSFTDPTGAQTQYAYDAASGFMTSITNPRGKVTSLTEDSYGRILSLVRHADSGTNPEYDFTYETGRTKVSDPDGNTTLFLVNASGYVTAVIDPLGHMQSTTYTTNADVQYYNPASAAGGGTPVTNTYTSDGLNNLKETQVPTGAAETFAYTSANNVYAPSKMTSPQGGSMTYTYDVSGNGSSATDSTSAAGQSSVTRNPDGTVATSTDANGDVTNDTYTNGQLTTLAPPSPRAAVTYTYDALSRVQTRTDGNGVTTTYGYDADDRVTSVSTPSATVTYTYDPAGNLTSVTDPSGTTTTTYDALNRIILQTLSVGGATAATYDGNGNLLTSTDASGTTHYHYNAVNLVDQLTDPSGLITTFAYNADNDRTNTTYPSGVQQVTTYDASDRVKEVRGVSPSNTSISDLAYTYNVGSTDTDLRQTVLDKVSGATTTYTYDALDRLTGAVTKNSGGTTTASYAYTYDKVGNRSTSVANGATTTATFNADDQTCWTDPATVNSPSCGSAPGAATTYTYDLAGNLTATTPPTGPPTTSTYDGFNQTTTQGPLSFAYAGTTQNDRTTSSDSSNGGQTFNFTQSLLGLTTRQDTTTNTSSGYTRDDGGSLVSTTTGSTTDDYLTDGLGSVIATVNATTGAVDQRYTYDPYGQLTSTNTGDTNPYRYAGQYQDQPTGTYATGARTLNTTLGAWTQPDPSGQDPNPYAYAGDDPINDTDPTGLDQDSQQPGGGGNDNGSSQNIVNNDCTYSLLASASAGIGLEAAQILRGLSVAESPKEIAEEILELAADGADGLGEAVLTYTFIFTLVVSAVTQCRGVANNVA